MVFFFVIFCKFFSIIQKMTSWIHRLDNLSKTNKTIYDRKKYSGKYCVNIQKKLNKLKKYHDDKTAIHSSLRPKSNKRTERYSYSHNSLVTNPSWL